MGNVREEGINMYLTDNYTPKMKQIISVTETFRRATVSVSLSTNVMASSIKNSMASASSSLNSLNSSLRKVNNSLSSASSTMVKLSSSINTASGAIGNLSGSIARLAVTIAMIIDYFNKLIQKKKQISSDSKNVIMIECKSNGIEKTRSKISALKNLASGISRRAWEIVIKVKDTAKRTVNGILEKLKSLTKNSWQSIINLKDMASRIIGKIFPKLRLFAGSIWRSAIAIKDMASSIIGKIFPKLRLFAGKVWRGTIAIKDMTSGILSSIKGKISDLTNGATIGLAMKKGVDLLGQEQNQKLVLENVMQKNTGKAGPKYVNDYYGTLEKRSLKTPFDPKEVISMGTKAMMLSKGNRNKADNITNAMIGVRAFNMDTTSEQDVSAAFVSASKGNMEAINNLVGENYKNFDEAIEGITEKQGALAEKMTQTIPGLIASAQTSIDLGLKHMMDPFDSVLKDVLGRIDKFIKKAFTNLTGFSTKIANVMNGKTIVGDRYDKTNKLEQHKMLISNKPEIFENQVATMIGNTPKAVGNAVNMLSQNIDFTTLIDSLFPVVNLVNNLLDNINNKSPVAQGLISIFGTIVTTAFQLIGPVVEAVSPIITRIFTFLGEHAPQINYFIETLGNVWKTVWETLGPILEEVWKFLEPLLDCFIDSLENLCDLINNICDLWSKMVKSIKENPITAKLGDFVNKRRDNYKKNGMGSGLAHDSGTNPTIKKFINKFGKNGKKDNKAFGLNYVPYNDYFTRLHEGEMVLTKQEANQYRNGQNSGNVSISKLADTIIIREEADIEKVTSKLVASIQMAQLGGVL